MFEKIIIVSLTCGVLAACAAQLPETGTSTVYDGKWSGVVSSAAKLCDGTVVKGEVRFGSVVAKLYWKGRYQGEVWGEIGPNGHLLGDVGASSVVVGQTNILFNENNASGDFSANECNGNIDLKKS